MHRGGHGCRSDPNNHPHFVAAPPNPRRNITIQPREDRSHRPYDRCVARKRAHAPAHYPIVIDRTIPSLRQLENPWDHAIPRNDGRRSPDGVEAEPPLHFTTSHNPGIAAFGMGP